MEGDDVKAVSGSNIAPNVSREVRRNAVQVDGRIPRSAGIWTAPAGADIIVAQDQVVGAEQTDTKGARPLHVVVRNPDRLSTERLAEDGFGAGGHEPVAAETQGGDSGSTREIHAHAVDSTGDGGVGDRNGGLARRDSVSLDWTERAPRDDQTEARRAVG